MVELPGNDAQDSRDEPRQSSRTEEPRYRYVVRIRGEGAERLSYVREHTPRAERAPNG
jgi:hypothetical protein